MTQDNISKKTETTEIKANEEKPKIPVEGLPTPNDKLSTVGGPQMEQNKDNSKESSEALLPQKGKMEKIFAIIPTETTIPDIKTKIPRTNTETAIKK